MRLGLALGHWGGARRDSDLALTREADRLGFDVVWAAEAFGTDAPSILAWLAAQTSRIGLGAGVMQIPARSAAATAMTAATLDLLSGGRFRLGLGVSGPQVSEGLHGVRFADPLGRTREYVDVVRLALDRKVVEYDGDHIHLPLPGGAGKALALSLPPRLAPLPIYLAALGPKNLELTGEIADGLLAVFFDPRRADDTWIHLRAGAARAGRGTADDPLPGFDLAVSVPVSIADDLDAAADRLRPMTALYVGGMGSKAQNFYATLAGRMGFGDAAARIQDLYLSGRPLEAQDAVPRDLIDATSLIGPPARIKERLAAYTQAGVTTLSVTPYAATTQRRVEALRIIADLF